MKTLRQIDENFSAPESDTASDGWRWQGASTLTLEGVGWPDESDAFCRFPNRVENLVREPMWQLSRCSAGVCVRFFSDASTLAVRWSLRREELAMTHMPASSVSGLDLYVRDPQSGRIRWASVARPENAASNFAQLLENQPSQRREYFLYLPLYNGVSQLEIGVDAEAQIAPAAPRSKKPICFYGASIVQGACASRPGMALPAQLGRRFDRAYWNFGFSGNSHAEPEIAALLAELDPSLYVIGPAPSLKKTFIGLRLEYFLQTLREAHASTPIVLVENAVYQDAWTSPQRYAETEAANRALRAAFEKLEPRLGNLHFIEGAHLMGDDGEATVDGTHPTDLGFKRMADALTPRLETLLQNA